MRKFWLAAAAIGSILATSSGASAAVITGVSGPGSLDISLLRYLHRSDLYTITATFDLPMTGYSYFSAHTEDKYNEYGQIGSSYYYTGGDETDGYDYFEFDFGSTGGSTSAYYSNFNYTFTYPSYDGYDRMLKLGRVQTLSALLHLSLKAGTAYRIEIAGPATVPEPASWALMILGFGSVGGMARRRRAEVSTAAIGL